jgi:hypothetical protein
MKGAGLAHIINQVWHMTRLNRLRLAMWTCVWVLQESMPKAASAFAPAIVTLLTYPVALHLAATDGGAFVVAFMAGYGTHAWLNLPVMVKSEAVSVFGSEAAVVLPLILIAAMVGIGEPVGCLRIFTVLAILRALILADDLWDEKYQLVQRMFKDPRYRASDAVMTKALLVWCIMMVLLVEVVIATDNLTVWLAFAALANLFITAVERALVTIVLLQRKDLCGD